MFLKKKTLENCKQTHPAGFGLARVTTNAIVLVCQVLLEPVLVNIRITKLRIECKSVAILLRLRTVTLLSFLYSKVPGFRVWQVTGTECSDCVPWVASGCLWGLVLYWLLIKL